MSQYKQETIKPYGEEGAKGRQVERMFDNIAHSYDLLNHTFSLGIDRYWRRAAIRSLKPFGPREILDVATGTGDFALLSARRLRPQRILGVDLSEGMLAVGRAKVERAGLSDVIHFQKEDCLHLSLPDAAFDAVTVAYGVRNFEDLDQGLREMQRVLRKDGRLVIIELTAPQRFPMRQLFRFYSHVLMPALGRLVSHDARAYTYLPDSVREFPYGERFVKLLHAGGFRNGGFRNLSGGIAQIYWAEKPLDETAGKER